MAMKLVAVVFAGLLALPNIARADDVLNPPGGPVYVEVRNDQAPPPERRAKAHRLKEALMEQFDMNGDGKLEPRERMRAVRVLGRIQQRLAGKGQWRKKFIKRFDTNHDGNVDQGEMPPRAARKLRRMDRDHDGWVEPNEGPR
jgi:hypothetical protein